MPILVEVALATNNVERILDDLLVLGTRKNRESLLELAILSSIRGLGVLANEPFIVNPDRYLADLSESTGANPASVREILRQDTERLRLFLQAECRLLHDLGVSDGAVTQIRQSLATAVRGSPENMEGMDSLIGGAIEVLSGELGRLEDHSRHGVLLRKLVGVLEALGGAMVVGADALVGAAASPVTGGLSIIGAGASGVLGTEVFARGARRALD